MKAEAGVFVQVGMQQHWESKLDAFDSFVAHAKFAPLAITATSDKPKKQPCSTGRKLIVVDDLPHVAGVDQKRRLTNSLGMHLGVPLDRTELSWGLAMYLVPTSHTT